MRRILTGLLLGICLTGSTQAEDLPTKEEVLTRFIAAVGGREGLLARPEVCYAGTIVQDLSWKTPAHSETPFRTCATSDGRVFYVESAAWTDLPAVDAQDLRRKLRWILHPAFALEVEAFFPDLTVVGRETRAGRPVIVLAPGTLKYEYYALYFDAETGLLNHVGYHNDLQDWRVVDGVRWPHTFVFGRKGGHTTYQFETVGVRP